MPQTKTNHLVHSDINNTNVDQKQMYVETKIDDSAYPGMLVTKPDDDLEVWQVQALNRAKDYIKGQNVKPIADDEIKIGTSLLKKLLPTNDLIGRFAQICADNRILLDLTTSELELSSFPWEACAYADWDKLGIKDHPDSKVAIIRTPDPYNLREPWHSIKQVRILFASVSPEGIEPVNYAKELRHIKEILTNVLGNQNETERYRYIEVWETTIESLKKHVKTFKPHIVHMVSHGKMGELYLEDTMGAPIPVSGFELRESLDEADGSVCLFVSTACMAMAENEGKKIWGLGHELVKTVPAVIGMQISISEEAAILFAEALYASLASSDSIIVAYTKARERLIKKRPSSPEWIAPVLYRGGRFNDPLFLPEEIPTFLSKTIGDLDEKLGTLKGRSSLDAVKNIEVWKSLLRSVNRVDIVLLEGMDKGLHSPTFEQKTLIENLEESITELRSLLFKICSLLEAKEENSKIAFEFDLDDRSAKAITKATIFRRKLNSLYLLYNPSRY